MDEDEKSSTIRPAWTRREFLKCTAAGGVSALLAPRAIPSTPSEHQSELQAGWRIISAREVTVADRDVSLDSFDDSHWHPIQRMPATVLQALEDAGVYKALYVGMNLSRTVPPD